MNVMAGSATKNLMIDDESDSSLIGAVGEPLALLGFGSALSFVDIMTCPRESFLFWC